MSDEIRQYWKPVSTTWLVDEKYMKILGKWHYLYRGVDQVGQVLDCWLSRTRDLAAAEAFFRPYDQIDRVYARARCHRQGHVLSIGNPHLRA